MHRNYWEHFPDIDEDDRDGIDDRDIADDHSRDSATDEQLKRRLSDALRLLRAIRGSEREGVKR